MTRFGIEGVAVKVDLEPSSSEVVVSTSLRSCVRNEGSPFVSCTARDGGLSRWVVLLFWRLEVGIDGLAVEGPGASRTLRVRGRFSFRSGFLGTSERSAGDAVTDLDFRFRLLGLTVSSSFAFSKAPQA